jgi:hypothetical protein
MKNAAVPFVLTPDGSTIAGYSTLSQCTVKLNNVPAEIAKKLPPLCRLISVMETFA